MIVAGIILNKVKVQLRKSPSIWKFVHSGRLVSLGALKGRALDLELCPHLDACTICGLITDIYNSKNPLGRC